VAITRIYTAGAFRSNIYEADGADPVAIKFIETARELRRIQDTYRVPRSLPILEQMGDRLRFNALGVRLQELAAQMEQSG
jgi:2-methylisocitrate lyase-like PEP mutase family enzyme